MSSSFAIIGTAWRFYKKQPVLNAVAFWFFFAPSAALSALDVFTETSQESVSPFPIEYISLMSPVAIAVAIPVSIAVIYLSLWGQACTLVICQRMIKSPAGRNRTSFAAVRQQAQKYIFLLFVTEVIRTCKMLLWGLLLVVPGIIYGIRTAFYDILIINDDAPYGRESLRRSMALVTGRTWEILWRMLVMMACVLLPAGLIAGAVEKGLTLTDDRLFILGGLISDAIGAYAGMFFLVCLIALFSELKKAVAPIGVTRTR
ncbi:hypothetical protein FJZ28_01080 [Candidatus Peregrinibacteria bacterium]|nr:hypothetical protein [Candidatus Peregrinibacteria bacterium]